MVNTNSVLSSILFSQTIDWNIKQFFSSSSINSSFELKRIGKAITRRKDQMVVEDDKRYKRITIKTNCGGVFVRDEVLGKDIKTKKQYYVKAGQLAVSKIDARNGAFGIVPPEADGAIITGNFWVYDVNPEIANIDYLILLLSSKIFVQVWQDCSNGSGNRLYLQEDKFLNYKIPLPSVTIQSELLKQYDSKISIARSYEAEVYKLEKEIEQYWLNSLGVAIDNVFVQTDKLIKEFSFRTLSRWDAWSQTSKYTLTKYQFSKFSSVVIGKPLYGANEKAVKIKSDTRYIRITDINEDGTLNDDVVSAKIVEEKYLLKENDFLIARSGNTVGKTFLYKESFGKCIFAGYLVRYKLNTQKIIPEYLLYYTKSSLFKTWIQNNQRIFGQPNINGQEYLNADIIIPDTTKQKEIAKYIGELYDKIARKKSEIKDATLYAQTQFEEAVFGEA